MTHFKSTIKFNKLIVNIVIWKTKMGKFRIKKLQINKYYKPKINN